MKQNQNQNKDAHRKTMLPYAIHMLLINLDHVLVPGARTSACRRTGSRNQWGLILTLKILLCWALKQSYFEDEYLPLPPGLSNQSFYTQLSLTWWFSEIIFDQSLMNNKEKPWVIWILRFSTKIISFASFTHLKKAIELHRKSILWVISPQLL